MFKSVAKEEIQVPAHIDYLGELRNFVTKAGRKHGFSTSEVNAFKLSIDEAATNIIKHAYRDWEGMIKMRVIIKKNSVTVLLIDQGKYFDPSRVQDPNLNRYVKIGKKGGLGIFIMRKLLDEIDYRHTEEGNELRLTKYKGAKKKKKIISYPSISFSLKTKYSLIAGGILTTLVIIGYFYFFFQRGSQVFNSFVSSEKPLCESIAREVYREGDLINRDGIDEYQLNSAYIGEKVLESIEVRDEVYRVIVTGNDNIIEFCSGSSLEIYSDFKIPADHKTPHADVISYKNKQNETVYNFSKNIIYNEVKIGTVYLEIKRDYVSSQVVSLRLKDLKMVILILTFGFLGIIVLIYIILNPFRKLANWVKDFGAGEVKDEIDFDTNDEVGEIAKAFSDITVTLRDSQKNLAEQERLQKEMQLAQDIQQTLLPSDVPELEGYEIASYYQAAKEVGGDYYDFIEVDKDTLGIVVADVSGKGVPGSLIMTMIRTALRTEARSIKSASEVLARVNDFVVNDMKKGMFVTLFYVIIDSKKRRINYASAGHNPMILYRQGTKNTYYLNPRGFPVGISLPDPSLFKKSIESDTIQLAEDDILIIYTDGITEAMNNRRELFSEERLQKAVRDYGNLHVQEFIDNLKEEIDSFAEGFEQSDDITLVAIKEKSSPEKIELQRAQKAHQMISAGSNIREACEESGITVYAYYNKYKKIFEKDGIDAIAIDDTIAVELKHLSIEEKTKIYDIIKLHPEYGAKRISEELNTERYSFTKINENRIYDELVRSRLNTRQLREAYIACSGRKKRMKPPGTPMLTLDGKIILDKRFEKFEPVETKEKKKDAEIAFTEKREAEKQDIQEKTKVIIRSEPDDSFYLESLLSMPIEDLLKKKRGTEKTDRRADTIDEDFEVTTPHPSKDTKAENIDSEFEDLLDEQVEDTEEKITFLPELEEEGLQQEKSGDETLDIDQDVSFRDIWKETDEETEVEISEEETETEETENNEQESDESELTDIDKISESSIDINEILNETEVDEEISDFEMLADDMSFKDELLNKEKPDKVDQSEQEKKFIHKEEITKADENLVEKEFSNIDFTFNDLLEEIENDIVFYDEDEIHNNGTEFGKEHLSVSAAELEFDNKVKILDNNAMDKNLSKENQMQNKHLLLGLRYYSKGKFAKAVEQFNRVIEMYPDFKKAYSILGNAYYHADMVHEAVEIYKKVKELDPGNMDCYENTGVIYANQGMLDKAIKEWKMVVKIDPGRNDILEHIEEAKLILKKKKQ